MSIVVSKSVPVVVRPSQPLVKTSGSKIVLLPMEKPIAMMPMTVLLAFEHPIIHDHEHEPCTAETIKTGLAQALVPYYPIAGRPSLDGDVHIDCTGELGVTFVAASANCTMEELMCRVDDQPPDDETAVVQQLAFNCTADDLRHRLLWVQFTTLSCGGFVVGVTWSHGVADGPGIAQFIQAFGELARGLQSPSVVPVRLDHNATTQAVPPFAMAVLQLMSSHKVSDLTFNNVTVPSSLINHIRGRTNDVTVTVFEAVAAVLWQCRTRAVMTNPEAPAVLLFVVNARKYLGAKEGYYGNCSMVHMAVAKSGAVANGDVMDVVEIIRRAKERIPEQVKTGGEDDDMMLRQIRELTDDHRLDLDGYKSFLYLSSWRNIGFEDNDFGSGKTARVMTYPQRVVFCMTDIMNIPICFMLKATPKGARVMSGCVTAQHADAFHEEIAKLNATT